MSLDTSLQMIFSGKDTANFSNPKMDFETLDEYTFGVCRGKWRDILRKKNARLTNLRFPPEALQVDEGGLQKHWKYWEAPSLGLL